MSIILISEKFINFLFIILVGLNKICSNVLFSAHLEHRMKRFVKEKSI